LILHFSFLVFGAFVGFVATLIVASFTQDLRLQFLISILMLLPLCVEFENIQSILGVDLIIQSYPVSDLIFLLNQVEFLPNSWVVLETIFSDLKQDFNHILYTLIDVGFV
jgi:hypothetical protein